MSVGYISLGIKLKLLEQNMNTEADKLQHQTKQHLTFIEKCILRGDYAAGVPKEEILKKFGIANSTFYRLVRGLKMPVRDHQKTIAKGEAIGMRVMSTQLNHTEMNGHTRNYLSGMAVTFGVTEEQIVDDLVQLSLHTHDVWSTHGQK